MRKTFLSSLFNSFGRNCHDCYSGYSVNLVDYCHLYDFNPSNLKHHFSFSSSHLLPSFLPQIAPLILFSLLEKELEGREISSSFMAFIMDPPESVTLYQFPDMQN